MTTIKFSCSRSVRFVGMVCCCCTMLNYFFFFSMWFGQVRWWTKPEFGAIKVACRKFNVTVNRIIVSMWNCKWIKRGLFIGIKHIVYCIYEIDACELYVVHKCLRILIFIHYAIHGHPERVDLLPYFSFCWPRNTWSKLAILNSFDWLWLWFHIRPSPDSSSTVIITYGSFLSFFFLFFSVRVSEILLQRNQWLMQVTYWPDEWVPYFHRLIVCAKWADELVNWWALYFLVISMIHVNVIIISSERNEHFLFSAYTHFVENVMSACVRATAKLHSFHIILKYMYK